MCPESGLDVPRVIYHLPEPRPRPHPALGHDLQPVRAGLLARSAGRLLSRLGQALLAAGRRLEGHTSPSPSTIL